MKSSNQDSDSKKALKELTKMMKPMKTNQSSHMIASTEDLNEENVLTDHAIDDHKPFTRNNSAMNSKRIIRAENSKTILQTEEINDQNISERLDGMFNKQAKMLTKLEKDKHSESSSVILKREPIRATDATLIPSSRQSRRSNDGENYNNKHNMSLDKLPSLVKLNQTQTQRLGVLNIFPGPETSVLEKKANSNSNRIAPSDFINETKDFSKKPTLSSLNRNHIKNSLNNSEIKNTSHDITTINLDKSVTKDHNPKKAAEMSLENTRKLYQLKKSNRTKLPGGSLQIPSVISARIEQAKFVPKSAKNSKVNSTVVTERLYKANDAKSDPNYLNKNMEKTHQVISEYILKCCKTELFLLYNEETSLSIVPSRIKSDEVLHDVIMIRGIKENSFKVLSYLNGIIDSLLNSSSRLKFPASVLAYLAVISGDHGIPPDEYFSEFEYSRLPISENGTYSDLNKDHKKMILIFLFLIRVLLIDYLTEPWKIIKGLEPTTKLINSRNLKTISSVLYHLVMDMFRTKLPKIHTNPGKFKRKEPLSSENLCIFNVFVTSELNKNIQVKDEMIHGLYPKSMLSTFYEWQQGEYQKITRKINQWFNIIFPQIDLVYNTLELNIVQETAEETSPMNN